MTTRKIRVSIQMALPRGLRDPGRHYPTPEGDIEKEQQWSQSEGAGILNIHNDDKEPMLKKLRHRVRASLTERDSAPHRSTLRRLPQYLGV